MSTNTNILWALICVYFDAVNQNVARKKVFYIIQILLHFKMTNK